MRQEEKQLLLQDICGRLPYGVQCETPFGNGELLEINTNLQAEDEQSFCKLGVDEYEYLDIDECKPYLRPMPSMTEEEIAEMNLIIYSARVTGEYFRITEYYNKKHLDYHDLIGRNLAIEAPKDMYNFNTKTK